MRFIELHRLSDGKPMLINLDDIADIRPSNDGEHAIIDWRGGNDRDRNSPIPMPTKESYKDIRGALIRAGVITI